MAYKPGQGWIPDPAADAAHDKRPGQAAALGAVPFTDSKRDVFLWRYVQQNLQGTRWIRQGRLRSHNQGSTGSCVGNGGAGAAEVTAACDMYMRREAEQPLRWGPERRHGFAQPQNVMTVWDWTRACDHVPCAIDAEWR